MDILSIITFLLSMTIRKVIGEFLTQDSMAKIESILYTGEESSLLQCAQRCHFIDKTSAAKFHDSICQCVKYKENLNYGNSILTGFFTTKVLKVVPKPKPKELKNVSVKKPSSQSSIYTINCPARKGNDGNWWSASITKYLHYQWWIVDIQEIVVIEHIIFLGHETDGYRNKGLSIYTRQNDSDDWEWCSYIGAVQKEKTVKVTCGKATAARYIRVRSNQQSFVYVYELQVFAYV